jgi:hypothetical protein
MCQVLYIIDTATLNFMDMLSIHMCNLSWSVWLSTHLIYKEIAITYVHVLFDDFIVSYPVPSSDVPFLPSYVQPQLVCLAEYALDFERNSNHLCTCIV